jgi:alpha-L-fucosidase
MFVKVKPFVKRIVQMSLCRAILTLLITAGFLLAPARARAAQKPSRDEQGVKAEHGMIGAGPEKASAEHTQHPDAQWFGDAGLGLFLHWGICSTKAMNISWPMIPGRALGGKKITDPAERERIIKEGDWNLTGKPNSITPNQYFAMAKDFNPQNYDPEKWCKAAKEAGFTYVVLTTRHHEGFALWPSAFGDFNTKNYMGGRDLLKPYVEACRNNGLKVGFYYSGPDWYFDREYMNFLYHGGARNNPEMPKLDADLKPRTSEPDPQATKKHQEAYAAMVKGQIEELLSNYGKIDVLWFDGKPGIPDGDKVISPERIRELQPGIVINPRLHGLGDYITYERNLKTDKVAIGWAEFCNTWQSNWSHTETPFKSNGYVLGQLARSRSLGINYLLGIGPKADGDLSSGAYENMAAVAEWMKKNGASVHGAKPLPPSESASVPATAAGTTRYLFAIPKFQSDGNLDKDILPAQDETLTLKGLTAKPSSVKLLGDGSDLKFEISKGVVSIQLPAAQRTRLVDVVQIDVSGDEKSARADR